MPSFDEEILEFLSGNAPRFGLAILILLSGWVLALLVAGLLRKAIQRTGLGTWLDHTMPGDKVPKGQGVDKWIARGAFYLMMILVFVAFFRTLGLGIISEPMDAFLLDVLEAAPRYLGPVALLVIAWMIASLLRFVVLKGLGNERVAAVGTRWLGLEAGFQQSVTRTLANTIYWIVFLVFALGILDALHMRPLLAPLQEVIQKVLGFLPNLFAAALILGFGWFFARIVQRLVAHLLESVGTDRLSDQVGLQSVLGSRHLSELLGTLSYLLVLVPVLISSLNALKLESVTQPVSAMLQKILLSLPDIVGAALLLVLAYFGGKVISRLISSLLTNAGFNRILAKLGVGTDPSDYNLLLSKMGIGEAASPGLRTPSEILGGLAFAAIVLLGFVEALHLVGFDSVAVLVMRFVNFCGDVLLALVIFGVGLFISSIVTRTIFAGGSPQARSLALLARGSILGLAGAMALQQMGLAEPIINLAFGILLGAVGLAVAIAFGLGGKDVAAQLLRDLVQGMRTRGKNLP